MGRGGERAGGWANGAAVVVEDHENIFFNIAGVVERFVNNPSRKRAISGHRDAMRVFPLNMVADG